jgi:hypothetical protein
LWLMAAGFRSPVDRVVAHVRNFGAATPAFAAARHREGSCSTCYQGHVLVLFPMLFPSSHIQLY